MEPTFWQQRWHTNQIGFHEARPHPLLLRHWPRLALAPGSRVFVPLCGKSLDLLWLRTQGHEVIGVELSAIAVNAFFAEHNLTPTVRTHAGLRIFSAAGYTLICGDYFALTPALLGPLAAVYDRAALIALPPAMRHDYAAALCTLVTAATRMLLITVDYDPSQITPPPFAVRADEIGAHYAADWDIEDQGRTTADIKGQPGSELAFTLTRR